MVIYDVLVRNCRLVQKKDLIETSILVDEGKIKNLIRNDSNIKADKIINANGNLVIPGCIDTHFHSREPSILDKDKNYEDFIIGTKAAAAGGYTTIFDMPITGFPPTTTAKGFNVKKKIAESKCLIDFSFYGGAGFGNLDEISNLADLGVIGFKIFTRETVSDDTNWNGCIIGSEGSKSFTEIMYKIMKTGRILSIHCENDRLINFLRNSLENKGLLNLSVYNRSSPNVSEFLEVSRSIQIAKKTGARIAIAHTSTAESIDLIKKSRSVTNQVFCETCPHYLLLTDKDMIDHLGPYGKVYPPLRSERDKQSLWNAIHEGLIDFIGTDHAPHPHRYKERGWKNIFEAPSGISGIETTLSLLLTEVNKGRMNIFQLVDLTSRNAAKIFGINNKKGDLEIGKDADFVIVDLKRESEIKEENMYSKSSVKVFDKMKVKGIPILTSLRGKIVMENGDVIGEPGVGKYIYPQPKVNL